MWLPVAGCRLPTPFVIVTRSFSRPFCPRFRFTGNRPAGSLAKHKDAPPGRLYRCVHGCFPYLWCDSWFPFPNRRADNHF